jgi:hypothetical protein
MIPESMVQAYERDGVIIVPEVLDTDTLQRVRNVIAELVAGAADVTEHTDVYDLEPGHTPETPRVRRIKTPHKVHPRTTLGSRFAPARLQAEHEVCAVWLAGGMAPGLGVLPAHQ